MSRVLLKILTVISLAAALVVMALNSRGAAQTAEWSEPLNISNSLRGSWFPDLAVDSFGNVHVVWCETEWHQFEGPTEYLYYTQLNEEGWTQPNDIVAASVTIHRSSIAADALGTLHLVVLDDWPPERTRAVYIRQAPAATAFSAGAWSNWRLVGGIPMGYTSDIVVDRENGLHVIYTESVDSDATDSCPRGGCSDVFYRRSRDGGRTWEAPVNLSQSAPGTKRLGLMQDWQGNMHAFWDEGGDRHVPDVSVGAMHTVSRNGGTSWSTPTLITATKGVPQQITAGCDRKGQTVIAWRPIPVDPEEWGTADPRIYYQVSTDGLAWSAPQPIPAIIGRTDPAGFTGFDQYDMGTDSAGRLHLVGVGKSSASDPAPGVFHMQWDGAAWSPPEFIFVGSGYPEYSRLAIEGGNILHVVWAVKVDSALGPQQIDVWYSRKQLSSPHWTPVPTPVRSPTPPPAPPTASGVLPTPYPTLSSGTKLPAGLDTESDELLLVAAALSPVILVILATIAVKAGLARGLRR